ncbi:hypothetical protein AAG570_010607 [Ranatra chinensis]|uniref:Uncharacterized protein n=1 Tax=Ranatra chinensis TaxID=642074 RepID=A0ABD0YNA7_9HEMI
MPSNNYNSTASDKKKYAETVLTRSPDLGREYQTQSRAMKESIESYDSKKENLNRSCISGSKLLKKEINAVETSGNIIKLKTEKYHGHKEIGQNRTVLITNGPSDHYKEDPNLDVIRYKKHIDIKEKEESPTLPKMLFVVGCEKQCQEGCNGECLECNSSYNSKDKKNEMIKKAVYKRSRRDQHEIQEVTSIRQNQNKIYSGGKNVSEGSAGSRQDRICSLLKSGLRAMCSILW